MKNEGLTPIPLRRVLTNCRIIDGRGGVLEKGFLIIEDSRIAWVGPVSEAPSCEGAEVWDLQGMSLLPGFIDTHVHLCLDGSSDPVTRVLSEPEALTSLRFAENAKRTLEAGITTVRDAGSKGHYCFAVRQAIQERLILGPRLLLAGRAICMTGGHGWWMGREADGVDEVRKAAREELKAGADFVKLMATGGIMTKGVEPGSPQLTYEELRAGVEEARKAGKRTATHAQGAEGIKNALRAGIDSIEHGLFLDEESIALMLEQGTFLVPTTFVLTIFLEKGVEGGIPDFMVKKAQAVRAPQVESFRSAYKAGVKMAMGTDAGVYYFPHGQNLVELQTMVELGMAPMEAICASTRVAAELLGLGDSLGTLEAGKLADLVVVEGNPLEDLRLLQDKERIRHVFLEGRPVVRRP
ncbi:MAG: amidohydrolase family protein [candidate division NC10 bacterium]|nr:amidohydrolase family protein [candidate division NC10 bacterium]